MDMYQKREMRKKKKNEDKESLPSMSINWYKPNYGKLPMKSYSFLHFITGK